MSGPLAFDTDGRAAEGGNEESKDVDRHYVDLKHVGCPRIVD
jgi:hypothetical protein